MAMMGKHVAYYRVSTPKQTRSGLGLEAQRHGVAEFLNGGDWRMVGEFIEVESGKKAKNRPEFRKHLPFAACAARDSSSPSSIGSHAMRTSCSVSRRAVSTLSAPI
jgi:hypothetical protein